MSTIHRRIYSSIILNKGSIARDDSTASQQTAPEGSYLHWVRNKDALKGARFGLPSKRIWDAARNGNELEYSTLMRTINKIKEAGAEIILGADFPSADEIISPDGWDWYMALPSGTLLQGL